MLNNKIHAFVIGDNQYQTTRLSAIEQLNLSRKIAPCIKAFLKPELLSGNLEADDLMTHGIINGLIDTIAQMPDEDVAYIQSLCYKNTSRNVGGNGHTQWQNIMLENGSIMFEDIDMVEMLQIIAEVIKFNLGPLFSGRLEKTFPNFNEQAKITKATSN